MHTYVESRETIVAIHINHRRNHNRTYGQADEVHQQACLDVGVLALLKASPVAAVRHWACQVLGHLLACQAVARPQACQAAARPLACRAAARPLACQAVVDQLGQADHHHLLTAQTHHPPEAHPHGRQSTSRLLVT